MKKTRENLIYFSLQSKDQLEENTNHNFLEQKNHRTWEDYYRRRWQYDKVVRSTHGVNCTGSCSFDVFVKDGIIVWEAQKTDYPTPHPDFPDYEPRGCPRGVSASWYVYSPLRVRYPYIRGVLIDLWKQAKEQFADPVEAWQSIVEEPEKRASYQKARGKGGFQRLSWEEANEIMSASLIYTIKKQGPDRVFAFTPLPAMSMVSFASGARFFNLIGGSLISFYDWYCDLPPASPQIWGEQTDVPESADWYNSSYIIAWGSNIPQTRTPDAHFFVEARYNGTEIVAIAPDYADFVKFADHWLTVKAGSDSALAMAMVHVVLQEFFLDKQVPYFIDYVKRFTDLAFLVRLDKIHSVDQVTDSSIADRFVRASDLGLAGNNPEWKLAVFDHYRNGVAIPNGSIGSRYGEEGKWNLNMQDCYDNAEINPALSLEEIADHTWSMLEFPVFSELDIKSRFGAVPTITLNIEGADVQVCTVYDLLLASMSLNRGHGGNVAKDYTDEQAYASPAWQEKITGVPSADLIRVARGFASNAEKTNGKSMIIMGAGINHWYNNDSCYRAILSLTSLCGCQGVNGGGWAHYVGQEKVRPLAGWATLTMASDWLGPPRLMNGTSFYYFAMDSWRYELLDIQNMCPPQFKESIPKHPADCNATAVRLGWLPYYPQFAINSLDLCDQAEAEGARTESEIVENVLNKIKNKDLSLAIDDPSNENNGPKIMFFWRTNPLGSNVKGHEYFLKHLLGTENAVRGEESSNQPTSFKLSPASEQGKLDLMVSSDFRMTTSCLFSDLVLPAAHWYEYHDLSSTDMHPFIHPFTAATDPAWEARTNWDQFATLAQTFSKMAESHLGVRKDLVTSPLLHDTAGEIAQAFGRVQDWTKGEVEAIPSKTMFAMHVTERNYPETYNMYSSLGPNIKKTKGVGAKGTSWSGAEEFELLKQRLGENTEAGITKSCPKIKNAKDACEIILALSPESNGQVSLRSWADMERQTGLSLADISLKQSSIVHTFESVTARPARALNSPNWSGLKGEQLTYTSFAQNIQRKMPFHTLSGRQHFFLDHTWIKALGETLPIYKPALDLLNLGETTGSNVKLKGKELFLNLITAHSKWSIHSTYSDNLILRTLSRGGGEIWLNDQDALSVGINDNEWLECFNSNGLFMGRSLVSHRIPRGKVFIYHAQERHVNTPISEITKQRAGTHNSLTRVFIKPSQMIGAYAQLSYSFNYYGPTGCQRDEMIVVRKATTGDLA